jgi:DNA-binding protein HU-beta
MVDFHVSTALEWAMKRVIELLGWGDRKETGRRIVMEKKSEVVAAIADGAGITQAQASAALDAYAAATLGALKAGGAAVLPGLGKFTAVHKEARQGRNPRTGETMTFAAKTSVKFKAAKAATDAVN